MALPRELLPIQEAVWGGSLPLEIRLAPVDCRTYDKSDPYLVQFPRLSYLPFLLPRLQAFFTPFCIERPETLASAWFSFEGVPLKWHYPLGLLYDLYSGARPAHPPSSHPHLPSAYTQFRPQQQQPVPGSSQDSQSASSNPLPWRLVLHFSDFPDDQLVRLDDEGRVLHDAFVNSIKEADYLRNGTAKAIMTLSKQDSTQLWEAVEKHDLPAYATIHNKLLPSSSELRHIPLRIYLPSSLPPSTTPAAGPKSPPSSPALPPSSPSRRKPFSHRPKPSSSHSNPPTPTGGGPSSPVQLPEASSAAAPPSEKAEPKPSTSAAPLSHLKVVQVLVSPTQGGGGGGGPPQTLGTALHAALPSLFTSRRTPVVARPVLHGAVLPMGAVLEEVMRAAAYLDGWIHLGVEMIG